MCVCIYVCVCVHAGMCIHVYSIHWLLAKVRCTCTQCRALVKKGSITGFYTNLTRSIKWIHGQSEVQFVATSNHLPSINDQNAALMSPNKDEQLSVTLPSFVLLDDWGGDHWLSQIGLQSSWPWIKLSSACITIEAHIQAVGQWGLSVTSHVLRITILSPLLHP